MAQDPRYMPVDNALPAVLPPCTRAEATKAMKRIVRHFGGKQHGGPGMRHDVDWDRVRTCWLSPKETAGSNHDKGWGRLIHDLSHIIFNRRHPFHINEAGARVRKFRPHHGSHALLELEIAQWVVAQGFMTGRLRESPKGKRKTFEEKLALVEARVKTWESKYTRAKNALRKLCKRRKALEKRIEADKFKPFKLEDGGNP
jgi:hypothetical protein